MVRENLCLSNLWTEAVAGPVTEGTHFEMILRAAGAADFVAMGNDVLPVFTDCRA